MSYSLNRSYLTLPGGQQPAATPDAQPGLETPKPGPDHTAQPNEAAALLSAEDHDQWLEETEKGHS